LGRKTILTGVLLAGVLAGSAMADWPQYAGPNRNNMAQETGLMKSWPAEGPKVLWTVKLGEGFGAAAIRDGQVFVLDHTVAGEAAKDVLRCFDLKDGAELWSYNYDAPGKSAGFAGSRAVPAVTEKHVFIAGPFGHFKCVDRTTHKVAWEMSLLGQDGKMGPWGLAQNPLLYKDSVIVGTQTTSGGLAAFDQATGKKLWQSAGVPSVNYSSPTLVNIGGMDQIVLGYDKGVAGVDPADGKVLWTFTGWSCNIAIPSPTVVGEGKLFATGGYGQGSAMFEVSKDAATGAWATKPLWKSNKGSQISQPVIIDGAMYFNGNSNAPKKEGLICMDSADGKVLWQTVPVPPTTQGGGPGKVVDPLPLDRGNLMLADGMIYMLDASGGLDLVQPSREAFKLVSSVKVLGGKDIWAPLAISGGKLVIRDQGQMKCLDIKQQ
jgi:outer membrane protein assembly factor BamB